MKHVKLFEQFVNEADERWVIVNPYKKKAYFSGIPNEWNLFTEKPKSPNIYQSKSHAEDVISKFNNIILRKQLKAIPYKGVFTDPYAK